MTTKGQMGWMAASKRLWPQHHHMELQAEFEGRWKSAVACWILDTLRMIHVDALLSRIPSYHPLLHHLSLSRGFLFVKLLAASKRLWPQHHHMELQAEFEGRWKSAVACWILVYCFSINAADLSPGVKLSRVEKDETSSSGALLSSMQHDAANAADVDARASRWCWWCRLKMFAPVVVPPFQRYVWQSNFNLSMTFHVLRWSSCSFHSQLQKNPFWRWRC